MVRKKHRLTCRFQDHSDNPATDKVLETPREGKESENIDVDRIQQYSMKLLKEGLLDIARKDASNEGDGMRTFNHWKFDFLSFAATGHTVYAGLGFQFISQVKFLLSKRKSAQLLLNRTVNLHGGEGRNILMP